MPRTGPAFGGQADPVRLHGVVDVLCRGEPARGVDVMVVPTQGMVGAEGEVLLGSASNVFLSVSCSVVPEDRSRSGVNGAARPAGGGR